MRVISAALMATLLMAACGEDGPWLARRAEEVRELEFDFYPEVTQMTREEFNVHMGEILAEITDEELIEYAETYGRLGYFNVGLELRPIVTATNTEWVGGMYWPATQSIAVVGEVTDDVIVHEYIHALQDQHFGFDNYDLYETSDGFLARRAIIEGDAVLAQYRFALQDTHGVGLGFADWLGVFTAYRGRSDNTIQESEHPLVFLDYPTFCYPYGFEFTAHNLTGVTLEKPDSARMPPYDWGLEDELFTERPADTTQTILLLDLDVDPVEPVGLTEVPGALADRLEVVDQDVLGEWYAFLLFYEAGRGISTTRSIAATWDGDRVLFLRDTDSGSHGFVWVSAWEDVNSVANVADALWTIYGRNPTGVDPSHFAHADDGEEVWIEPRDNRIVVTKNIAYELIDPLVEAAFAASSATRALRRRPSLAELTSRLRPRP